MEKKICDVTYSSVAKIEKNDAIKLTRKLKPNFYKRVRTDTVMALTGSLSGTNLGFDKDIRPEPQTCGADVCSFSGTYLVQALSTGLSYTQTVRVNATEVGVVRYIISVPNAGTYVVNTLIFNCGATDTTDDANAYTFNLEASTAGDYEIVVNLSEVSYIQGGGWVPTNDCFVFSSQVLSNVAIGDVIGFSSIDLFRDMRDLNCEIIAKATCLSAFSVEPSIEYSDTVCTDSKPTTITVEGSFTARLLEDNMMMMVPGVKKSEVDGITYDVIKDVVLESKIVNGMEYAGYTIADYAGSHCSELEVILSVCENGQIGRRLEKLCVSDFNQEVLPNNSYIILGDNNNIDRYGTVILDKSFIGKTICISFPTEATYTEYAFTNDFSQGIDVKAEFGRVLSDGRKQVITIGNLKITAFPISSTSDESSPEVEVAYKADIFDSNKLVTVKIFD